MKRALIAFAEDVAIVLKCRRWNRRVAESWMAIHIRSKAFCHVAAGGFESVMEAALSNLRICRWRWWHFVSDGPRM